MESKDEEEKQIPEATEEEMTTEPGKELNLKRIRELMHETT